MRCDSVTSIADTTFGNHTYAYDYRGFLTKADDETYSYDKNGNITKLGLTNLTYDSTVKDKLISVGVDTVSYANAASLNPTGWNGKT